MTDALASEIAVTLAAGQDPGPDLMAEAAAIIEAARREAPEGAFRERALAYARERAAGKPLGYLLGRAPFMGLELLASAGALVPRAETEILGRAAVDVGKSLATTEPGKTLRIVDMCCGAGNLACAIAWYVPTARVWAADLTSSCVAAARRNVQHLDLAGRVEVFEGDLFAPLAGLGLEGSVDMIVANPPYISTSRLAADRAPLLQHEPREAFDGGPYGLSIHQRIIREALPFLVAGGALMFEFGLGQDKQVSILFDRSRAYDGFRLLTDEAGHARAAAANKKR